MSNSHFDYAIIGNGLAGFQLALEFTNDSFFDDKSIALIDYSKKNTNDKTWCFWEKGNGKWDTLVSKSWKRSQFISSKKQYDLDLQSYSYKMIKSIDFYNHAKSILLKRPNFQFVIDTVETVTDKTPLTIVGSEKSYSAKHVFDSRIPKAYFSDNDNYTRIFQHFKGIIIEVEEDCFNPEVFTMMDYRIKHNNDTTFTYLLPFSKRKALVEFTFFTPYSVEETIYDDYLETYIKDILKVSEYKILETETGTIPMTNFPFKNYNSKNITKIGTGGGWVKGSTGYSFKHTERKVAKVLKNLKESSLPHKDIYNKKYEFYDAIFLKVLNDNNKKGEWIFNQFYTKNKTNTMFKFLDEESTFFEDLAIMNSLFSMDFIKAFFKSL